MCLSLFLFPQISSNFHSTSVKQMLRYWDTGVEGDEIACGREGMRIHKSVDPCPISRPQTRESGSGKNS